MNADARKQTLRSLSNGMYIVTSSAGGRHGAATITWLSQASFAPPLVMAAIRPESTLFQCLSESGVAAIHVLDESQQDIAFRFFRHTNVVDDTINGEPFTAGTTRAPILTNAAAYVECLVRQMVRMGDHAVVIFEVIEAGCRRPLQPLTVAASPWRYGG
jgi:flavin reductase (DIM6/NTAB) family NADH-FMN oxidoreductase RutF